MLLISVFSLQSDKFNFWRQLSSSWKIISMLLMNKYYILQSIVSEKFNLFATENIYIFFFRICNVEFRIWSDIPTDVRLCLSPSWSRNIKLRNRGVRSGQQRAVKQPVSQTPQQCQWRVWGKGNWNCLHGTQINRDIHIRTKCICISNKI